MSNVKELERRIYDILQCTICLTLPKDNFYQCTNGHLICPGCLTQLMTLAQLEDNNATCVRCQSSITCRNVCRNVSAELIAAELPAPCRFCGAQLPRKILGQHELELCGERKTECRYRTIGCRWRGSKQESRAHEMSCSKIIRPGTEILKTLAEDDHEYQKKKQHYGSIFELLSTPNIVYKDVQFGPYDNGTLKGPSACDLYDTFSFPAFKNWWRIAARLVRKSPRPVMTYKLIMYSEEMWPCTVEYVLLQGPYGAFRVQPRIVKSHFGETAFTGPEVEVTLSDPSLYALMAKGTVFNFRFIMFLLTKEDGADN